MLRHYTVPSSSSLSWLVVASTTAVMGSWLNPGCIPYVTCEEVPACRNHQGAAGMAGEGNGGTGTGSAAPGDTGGGNATGGSVGRTGSELGSSGGETDGADAETGGLGGETNGPSQSTACGELECQPHASCLPEVANPICNCNDGYELQGDGCVDLDECEDTPCGDNEICKNELGSFTCSCAPGFYEDLSKCWPDMVLVSAVEENLGTTSQVESGAMSADGTAVAFFAAQDEFEFASGGSRNVLTWRRRDSEVVLASATPTDKPANGTEAGRVSLSGDGSVVAFASDASDLVDNDTNDTSDIFVRVGLGLPVTRVSVTTGTAQTNGASNWPSLSRDGSRIAFQSYASNLVPGDTNGKADIFVRDRTSGTTTRVSVSESGLETNATCKEPAISGSGLHVAFSCFGTLTTAPSDNFDDVYVADLSAGTSRRVSRAQTPGAVVDGHSRFPAISRDGQVVAFSSLATNLIANDTNETSDIFVWDGVGNEIRRVSISSTGEQANGSSTRPFLSDDGRYVLFESDATNLAAADLNQSRDVFVHDRETETTTRISEGVDGQESNAESWARGISEEGLFALFATASETFGPQTGGVVQLWLKRIQP